MMEDICVKVEIKNGKLCIISEKNKSLDDIESSLKYTLKQVEELKKHYNSKVNINEIK